MRDMILEALKGNKRERNSNQLEDSIIVSASWKKDPLHCTADWHSHAAFTRRAAHDQREKESSAVQCRGAGYLYRLPSHDNELFRPLHQKPALVTDIIKQAQWMHSTAQHSRNLQPTSWINTWRFFKYLENLWHNISSISSAFLTFMETLTELIDGSIKQRSFSLLATITGFSKSSLLILHGTASYAK